MTVKSIIQSLLPEGTEYRYALMEGDAVLVDESAGSGEPDWSLCPAWPPDLFAVVATLVDRSSCYTFAGPEFGNPLAHVTYLEAVGELASKWTNLNAIPEGIQDLWSLLVGTYADCQLQDVCEIPALRQILLKLFAIADEASKGMGWPAPEQRGSDSEGELCTQDQACLPKDGLLRFADVARATLMGTESPQTAMRLPFEMTSLCSLVPMDVAIVLPKSITASVGCTVRSLSHHLALLPGSSQISPAWHITDKVSSDVGNESMRLLVIPFPFHIPDDSFRLSREPVELLSGLYTAGYFALSPAWLKDVTAQEIVEELIAPLIRKAEIETGGEPVHGVLFPECALTASLGEEVADLLADEELEFFITGALQDEPKSPAKNVAQTHIFTSRNNGNGEIGRVALEQRKHHRWRLDRSQVSRYALSFPDRAVNHGLNPGTQWWEDIDVTGRVLPFCALRQDVSMTVLICEDLARNDPAMSVIRAVGPNLVIALLMDGPQLSTRWPSRYATVLADDPGSSVLSITCAAMVDRSNWRESRPVRSVGLWRDATGLTQELNLPHGCQGLLLTLGTSKRTQHTLDNRSDNEATRQLVLRSVIPLALEGAISWL